MFSVLFSNHVAAEVAAPLLTRKAIDTLYGKLTFDQAELWHSLGNAWNISRYESPYRNTGPSLV